MSTTSTVSQTWDMRCPSCRDDTQIDIWACVYVRLRCEGTDIAAVAVGDHEWDDEDTARCSSCGHVATVAQFRIEEAAPPIPAARLALQMVLDRGDDLLTAIERSADQFGDEITAYSAAADQCESQLELIDTAIEAATAYVQAVALGHAQQRADCLQALRISLDALQSSDRKD